MQCKHKCTGTTQLKHTLSKFNANYIQGKIHKTHPFFKDQNHDLFSLLTQIVKSIFQLHKVAGIIS